MKWPKWLRKEPPFHFSVRGRLELLVWEYALAKQTMLIEVLDGDGKTGSPFLQAEKRRKEIEGQHGEELRAYLAPYVNRPRHLVTKNEWHRWYIADNFAA